MKLSKTVKGRIGGLLWWPLFLLPVIIAFGAAVYFYNEWRLYEIAIFIGAYLIFVVVWFFYWNSKLEKKIRSISRALHAMEQEGITRLSVAYTLADAEGRIISPNDKFISDFGKDGEAPKTIDEVSAEILKLINKGIKKGIKKEEKIVINERTYIAEVLNLERDKKSTTYAITITDVTDYENAIQTIDDMNLVSARIIIDNYTDLMEKTEEGRENLLSAFIEREIGQYVSKHNGFLCTIDKGKFMIFMNKKDYLEIEKTKFAVIEEIKEITMGNSIPPTLSIGVGHGGENIVANCEMSRLALDLCLSRGGDQAVVRTPDGPLFFGGKTEKTENTNRVKSRIVAQTLKEKIEESSRVLVMGHKLPDSDSLGSAIGIYRIARTLGVKAYVVFEEATASIRPMLEKLESSEPKGTFISKIEAMNMLDSTTLVILVDTSRPSYTECEELVEKAKNIGVIDHHRQGSESVENTEFSYVDPYSSSASEMITELMQYVNGGITPTDAEAEALYAGIIIDTDNFLAKTGPKTFEAAAYLKRCGADMTNVRKLFRESMEDFKAKAETISTVEIFEDAFAIGRCEAKKSESPTIIGAQAANDLLDIKGIKASFVFTEYKGEIYISARSIDEINVQLVMEKLGGGGHLSVAGAQLVGSTLEDAITRVKETLKQMLNEGEI